MAGDLPYMKPEDYQYFGFLLNEEDEEEELSPEKKIEREIMKLLFKIKNGTPPQRETALRQLIDQAREFGAEPLFNRMLPLLGQSTLEDQERHLLVNVFNRVLYRLDELVRPYVHKILVVVEPLLMDEDVNNNTRVEDMQIVDNLSNVAGLETMIALLMDEDNNNNDNNNNNTRVEGMQIVYNLSNVAGLETMIAAMRHDIDSLNEYVRNKTARAFSIVVSTFGIPAVLPFLKAVCQNNKCWTARCTGIMIVQQIAILMGCAVLPHLRSLVEIIEHGFSDENQKIRTITALAVAALAEAAAPYAIESFDSVLKPLFKGIRSLRGKTLGAYLKAIGFIIPLMDAVYASYYTKEVMVVLIRESQSPDKEMKKIVLQVVNQCLSTEGVKVDSDILELFKNLALE